MIAFRLKSTGRVVTRIDWAKLQESEWSDLWRLVKPTDTMGRSMSYVERAKHVRDGSAPTLEAISHRIGERLAENLKTEKDRKRLKLDQRLKARRISRLQRRAEQARQIEHNRRHAIDSLDPELKARLKLPIPATRIDSESISTLAAPAEPTLTKPPKKRRARARKNPA